MSKHCIILLKLIIKGVICMTTVERGRIFSIFFENPYNAKDEEIANIIKNGLNHRSIKEWLYVDIPVQLIGEDDFKFGGTWLIMRFSSNIEKIKVENWFGGFLATKHTGKDVFIESIYDTLNGKYGKGFALMYFEKSKIKSNFDWIEEIAEYEKRRLKKANKDNLSELESMKFDVLYKGKTLRECQRENEKLYVGNIIILQKLRKSYLQDNRANKRVNYFIYGKQGISPLLYSKILARSLYPDFEEEELIFYADSYNTREKDFGLKGYDGQPVIIYNNLEKLEFMDLFRAETGFLTSFRTTGVFNIYIQNEVNIVLSDVPFEEYFKNVYDKRALYEAFPLTNVIKVDDEEFMEKYEERQKILSNK